MHRADGHTLIEAAIGLALVLLVATGAVALLAQVMRLADRLPTTFDLQQRSRVALDQMSRDVQAAGGGADLISGATPLAAVTPAVWPRRLLHAGLPAEPARTDVFTTLSVAGSTAQATLAVAAAADASAVTIAPAAHCPGDRPACGFTANVLFGVVHASGLVVLGRAGPVDGTRVPFTALAGSGETAPAGAAVAEVAVRTYEWDRASRVVRLAIGASAAQALIDDVDEFTVRYFTPDGELPIAQLADGPWRSAGALMFDEDALAITRVRLDLRLSAGRVSMTATTDAAVRVRGDRPW